MTTGPQINGVPLREYVEALFAEKDKAISAALEAQKESVKAALEAADKAVTKAEANAEKWRENANEWRGAMSDRDRELPSRREVDTSLKSVIEKIEALAARLIVAEATLARGSGAGDLVAALARKTDEQDSRLDLLHGRSAGVSASVALMLTLGGIALAILFFYLSHRR